jgi:hypothetical protein
MSIVATPTGYRIECETADGLQTMLDGILARYPSNPYGTFVSWRGEYCGKWVAIVEGILGCD